MDSIEAGAKLMAQVPQTVSTLSQDEENDSSATDEVID